ncbi:MAG: DUF4982 domain-containing protein [Acidobacteria bacterium]|nr:DUF4982 domain-containing protein [Acidobacteriota bacterium]
MKRRVFLETVTTGVAAASQLDAGLPPVAGRKLDPDVPRWREKFNAGWRFRRQQQGGGALGSWDRDAVTGSAIEPAFQKAHLPAYDDAAWEFLEFEGVNQVAEFWVNGQRAGSHQGGYSSFELDITPYVHFGPEPNLLTVKVDNLYNPNIAPTVKTDLTYYGGIYREAWLRFSEPVYLSELFWRTPAVSASSAEVQLHSAVSNSNGQSGRLALRAEILDAEGKVAASGVVAPGGPGGTVQTLTVANPRLWSPDTPYRYRIRASLELDGRLVDRTEIPLGFRWFNFDADQGFFLNGTRLQLRGTTWHQSYPGMGSAVPDSRRVKDMEVIREMGCNFFRTSHYPHDPAVIEACDRLGLIVLEEIFVGEEVEDTPAYYAIQARTAQEMIVRDRNNPCLVLWGFSGEVDAPEKSVRLLQALVRRYRELDPTRIVTMHAPRVEGVREVLDVVGLYNEDFRDTDLERAAHPKRKYLIEEYTAAAIGRGIFGMGPESEDLGCMKHEEFLRQVNLRPWIAGSALWHQFDYDGEEYDPVIPHVVTFGLLDSWRIPKDAYYFYRSQWNPTPLLHICGHWTWPGDESKPKTVKVFTNLDSVELLLNGRSLGALRAKPDGLEHPPLVWTVPYEPGTLKAIGRSGNQTLEQERKTAGPPARIQLRSDADAIRSGDPDSLAYLAASIVDKEGTVVPGAFPAIAFSSYGPGELLPQTWPGHPTGLTWNAIAGMTGIAFRATGRVGRAVVIAYTPGLTPGRVEIQVAAPGQKDQMEYRTGAAVYK